MLISFPTLVLASQLIVTVDNVPKFNIERGCKVDSSASSLDTGLDETIKRCVHDEQQAQDQLQTQWSQFAPSRQNDVHQLDCGRRRYATELC